MKSSARIKNIGKITAITLAAIVLLYSIASIIGVRIVHLQAFKKTTEPLDGTSARLTLADVADIGRREISFQSGKHTLRGYLFGADLVYLDSTAVQTAAEECEHLDAESIESNRSRANYSARRGAEAKGLVVISHGMKKGLTDYLAEMRWFVQNGYVVLMYNNTGCYTSDGGNGRGLPQSAIDLTAALEYISKEDTLRDLSVFLYGHSWGGYAVTSVLQNAYPNVRASVALAGFDLPFEMAIGQVEEIAGKIAYIEYPFLCGDQTLNFGGRANLSAVDSINRSGLPVMIVQGETDEVVNERTSSIYSHRDRITNTRASVRFLPNRNHNDLPFSDAAVEYRAATQLRLDELQLRLNNKVSTDALIEFYRTVDRNLYNEHNAELMQEILQFFADSAD